MEGNAVDAINLAGSVGAADFSMWSLFIRADWVVKLVIVMLLAASVWSWAIIFDKTTKMRKLNGLAREFENTFWSGTSLDDLFNKIGAQPKDPMSAVLFRPCANGVAQPKREPLPVLPCRNGSNA